MMLCSQITCYGVPLLVGMVLLLLITTTSTVQCQLYEPCNFCRSPNIVNNPNQNIDSDLLALLGISQPKFTCQDLYLIGIEGWFNDNICLYLQSIRRLRINCKCSPIIVKPPTTTKPTSSPILQPPTVQPTTSPTTINNQNNKGGMDKVMNKKPKQSQTNPITTAPAPVLKPTTAAPVPIPVPFPTPTTLAPAPAIVVAPITQAPVPLPVPTITLTAAPAPDDGVATIPTTQVPVPVPVPIIQPTAQQGGMNGGGMVKKTKTNAPR